MGFSWHIWAWSCVIFEMCGASALTEHVVLGLLHWWICLSSVGLPTILNSKKFLAVVCDWENELNTRLNILRSHFVAVTLRCIGMQEIRVQHLGQRDCREQSAGFIWEEKMWHWWDDVSRQTPGLVAGYVSICNYHVGWELGAGSNEVSLVVAGQQSLDRMYESLVQRFPNGWF